MRERTKNILYALILVIAVAAFMEKFYHGIMFCPNDYMTSISEDGIKNYTNFWYHVNADSLYSRYQAVYYPYGESILFTDIHPVLATTYKAFANLFPAIKNYTVGFLNVLMVWSYPLAAVFLFFLLRGFGVSVFTSFFGALSVTVLSSYVILWTFGHIALSYPVIIPLGWWLYEKFLRSENKTKWSVIIALNTLFWFFIHGYDGVALVLFYSALILVRLFAVKQKQEFFREVKYYFLQVIVPVFVFYTAVKLNDIYPGDRIDYEFVSDYISHPFLVFVPHFGIFKDWFYFFYNFDLPYLTWSRVGNYVGVAVDIVLLVSLLYYRKTFSLEHGNRLKMYLAASVLVLLYSFGIPFKFNLGFLLDYVPMVKQLLGLGRFAWVFYFVAGVFSFWFLDKFVKNRALSMVLVFVATIISTAEAVSMHLSVSEKVMNGNVLSEKYEPLVYREFNGINARKYQAAIILPYFVIFGNPYAPLADDKTVFTLFMANRFLHLPVANAHLSRNAVTPAKEWMQEFSPFNCDNGLSEAIKNNKPFLVIHTHSKLSQIQEDFLKYRCKLLKRGRNFDFYEYFPKNDYKRSYSQKVFEEFDSLKDSLEKKGMFYTTKGAELVFMPQDSLRYPVKFIQPKSYGKIIKDDYSIFTVPASRFDTGETYEMSFWYFNKGFEQFAAGMVLGEYSPSLKKYVWKKTVSPTHTGIICGDWTLVTFDFTVNSSLDFIILYNTHYKLFGKNRLYINNLVIRNKKDDFFVPLSRDTLVMNNRVYVR